MDRTTTLVTWCHLKNLRTSRTKTGRVHLVLKMFLLAQLILAVLSTNSFAIYHLCSSNPLVGNDLTSIEAEIEGGFLTVKVCARELFNSFMAPTTSSQVEFFIDADQDPETGDERPGAIRGADYRISCLFLLDSPVCTLYLLPTTFDGQEVKVDTALTATLFNQGHCLQVSVPSRFTASDVFAFAHGRSGFYSGKTGNGDRCPETGAFNTVTGTVEVRQPASLVDAELVDRSGTILQGWGFQTFGDQFRIHVSYQSPIDPLSVHFMGRVDLDTDRSLRTGLVQTPFLIHSPFNEIPSRGWDVAIQFQGGGGVASDPTPFYLDFGAQSPFIQPLQSNYAFPYGFPFGERYNDGRWYVQGNYLVLEGSLSILDARKWRLSGGGVKDVSRVPTDGRVIGRLFTKQYTNITDMIPKNDQAFDFAGKTEVPAIKWIPEKMVSGTAPANDAEAQWDLTQVDAQIDGENLVIRGTLTRLESTWLKTSLHVLFDTDSDSQTGTPINNPFGEAIGSDYEVHIFPLDLWGYIGYTVDLYKPDGSKEGHDSWLNMNFSDPSQADSPAQFLVTVPLIAIDNPRGPIRLYVASSGGSFSYYDDIAPSSPLSLYIAPPNSLSLDPPTEKNIGICDATCQASAPVTRNSVVFNYTGNVNIVAGVMNSDFSSVWWLNSSCVYTHAFAQAGSGIQTLKCSVSIPSEAVNGWVFWLVTPVDLVSLDWDNGAYDLLFYQLD